jgi:hypothetical protein
VHPAIDRNDSSCWSQSNFWPHIGTLPLWNGLQTHHKRNGPIKETKSSPSGPPNSFAFLLLGQVISTTEIAYRTLAVQERLIGRKHGVGLVAVAFDDHDRAIADGETAAQ